MSYDEPKRKFAWVEEAYDASPRSQFEGASAYHRCPQFGGDPGFADIWTASDAKPGEEIGWDNYNLVSQLVGTAITTEIDLATLGYAQDHLKFPMPVDFEERGTFERILDIAKTGKYVPAEATYALIAKRASERVGKALALIA